MGSQPSVRPSMISSSLQIEVKASLARHGGVLFGVPARGYAKISPRVRALQRAPKMVPSNSRGPAPESGMQPWSSEMISAASKAGNLPIAPLNAELLLKDIADLKQKGLLSRASAEKIIEGMYILMIIIQF